MQKLKDKSLKNIKITFIKTSSEELIKNYVDAIFNKLMNKNMHESSFLINNPITHTIGLRVFDFLSIKKINFFQNVQTIIQDSNKNTLIELFDYNYLLQKKFRYLRNEVIDSDILIFLVNIYDKVRLLFKKEIHRKCYSKYKGNKRNYNS